MIKIEHIETYGWEAAIRGMRNPLNSWDKSDSFPAVNCEKCGRIEREGMCTAKGRDCTGFECFYVGNADLKLMQNLVAAGPDHGKFMRMIGISMDITAPLYWWSEFDTYKVGTVANSCSKMHKLLAKPFEMNDFSFDKLPGYKNEIKQFKPEVDEAKEQWKDLNPFYSVSDCGRIKNRRNGRILSGSLHNDGYIFVTIDGTQKPLHRLIAHCFCEGYEEGKVVNHKDGNKQNNFATNLEWATQRENVIHSFRSGLQGKSVKTYAGKFTQEERENIKRLYDDGGMSKREIARRFEVSHTCINDIVNDKYKYAEHTNVFEEVARPIVDTLNELRDSWFTCENEEKKKIIWYSILQLLPSSYNQRRTVTLNYAVARNQYHARKAHKLTEWHDYCKVLEGLPYAELITMEGR